MKGNVVLAACCLVCALGLGVSAAQAERTDNLTKAVAKQAGITEEEAEERVKLVFGAIESELNAGREVNIRRFGRFWLQDRNARQGRNPRTGAAVQIPEKRYPRFSSSDLLKDGLNPEGGRATPAEPQTQQQ
jgi:nucleoid DNA-binding protein